MPDLDFQVTGVEAASRGLAPLLHFTLRITGPQNKPVESLILQAQIQIVAPGRNYNAAEKEKLAELFGTPDRWGQTLRNKHWTNAGITVGKFTGETTTVIPVPCTYDLNVTATKYFHALEGGEAPLLFLFSGTIFYTGGDGRLQAERISWNKECTFRMPVCKWDAMMHAHYPNSAWIALDADVFEELHACKRRMGAASWEETIRHLLQSQTMESPQNHEPVAG